MGFQTSVTIQPSPAVAGDFADANPRFSVDAGPGGLVAGPNGLVAGRFAWWAASGIDPDGTPTIVNNTGAGPVTGFGHREQRGLITAYLAESSMTIPVGFEVGLMSSGSFWVKIRVTAEHNPGRGAGTEPWPFPVGADFGADLGRRIADMIRADCAT